MKPIIRKGTSADALGIATVQTLSWKITYNGIIADTYLDNLDIDSKAEWWTKAISQNVSVYVAETDRLVGFATGGKGDGQDSNYEGELYAIYLLKEFQGKGIGKMLFDEVAKEMTQNGINSMLVWVLKDNPSKDFYIKQGGKLIKEEVIEIGNQKLTEEAYGWSDLSQIH